jgi:hypothetical protein
LTRRSRPFWWEWEFVLSDHILDRMADRGFTEIDLRAMLGGDIQMGHDIVPGRWLVHARLRTRPWEVIIEPIHDERIVLVITAYPVWGADR